MSAAPRPVPADTASVPTRTRSPGKRAQGGRRRPRATRTADRDHIEAMAQIAADAGLHDQAAVLIEALDRADGDPDREPEEDRCDAADDCLVVRVGRMRTDDPAVIARDPDAEPPRSGWLVCGGID